MDLRHEQRYVHPEACFACRWATEYAVIWPLEPDLKSFNNDGYYLQFYVFVNVHAKVPGLKSGRKTLTFCTQHAERLFRNWVMIAQDEVNLQKAWDDWIERME